MCLILVLILIIAVEINFNELDNGKFMENPLIENKLLEIFHTVIFPETEQFVLSLNTLGSDTGISEEKRHLTFKFLRLFESKWEHQSKYKVSNPN